MSIQQFPEFDRTMRECSENRQNGIYGSFWKGAMAVGPTKPISVIGGLELALVALIKKLNNPENREIAKQAFMGPYEIHFSRQPGGTEESTWSFDQQELEKRGKLSEEEFQECLSGLEKRAKACIGILLGGTYGIEQSQFEQFFGAGPGLFGRVQCANAFLLDHRGPFMHINTHQFLPKKEAN